MCFLGVEPTEKEKSETQYSTSPLGYQETQPFSPLGYSSQGESVDHSTLSQSVYQSVSTQSGYPSQSQSPYQSVSTQSGYPSQSQSVYQSVSTQSGYPSQSHSPYQSVSTQSGYPSQSQSPYQSTPPQPTNQPPTPIIRPGVISYAPQTPSWQQQNLLRNMRTILGER